MSPKERFRPNPEFANIREDVSGWVGKFINGMAAKGNQPEYILDNLVKLKLGADPYEIFGDKISELVISCEAKFESAVIESWVLSRIISAQYSSSIRSREEYQKFFLQPGFECSFPKVFKAWFEEYAPNDFDSLISFY